MSAPKRPIFFTALWPDIAAGVLLLAIVALVWCSAYAKWDAASWNLPTSYLEPIKCDVISTLAADRAAADGNFVPFKRKTIPELGAPYDGNWNDWPIIEEFHIYFLGLLTKALGLFAALNAGMLLVHMTAALAFYGVARYSQCTIPWAMAGALGYGLAAYIFAQLPNHISVAAVWHIPLFLLVWRWVSTEPGIPLWSGRFWFAIATGLSTGLQNVYYTNILCQLTLLSAGVLFIRNRSWPALFSALAVIAAAALAFASMNIDTWLYRLEFGPNTGAVIREYKWLEIYGLKLVDFFVPPLTHQCDYLRDIAVRHLKEAALLDEGSYFGFVGLGGLLLLIWTSASALFRQKVAEVPMAAWQILWIFVYAVTGGLNTVIGLFGFTLFRTGCRYSIVIFAIVLLFLVQRLSAWFGGRMAISVFGAMVVASVVLWDQVPRPPTAEETKAIARQVESDRKFTVEMEAAVPDKSNIFQLPVMDFPESPLPTVSPYEHFRPYLYSRDLRFSFGSVKGRSREEWQHALMNLPLQEAIVEIKLHGFAGIYLNRRGYSDGGGALTDQFRAAGYPPTILSSENDLVFIPLKGN